MRKINRTDVLKMVLVLAFVGAIGVSMGAIGRFTPTHAIVEPVFCGSCHPDQIRELNATTHLPHFASGLYEESEAIVAGSAAEVTKAEAVSGACMMCHSAWANREKLYVSGYYNQPDGVSGETRFGFNDVVFAGTDNVGTQFDVAINISAGNQVVRLGTQSASGTNYGSVKVVVQDVGGSSLTVGDVFNNVTDFVANGTDSIEFLSAGTNTSALSGLGSVKITYKVSASQPVTRLDVVWGDLSALSPLDGAFFNDQQYMPASATKASCGNPEKGMCHAVEVAISKNIANMMQENHLGTNGKQFGSGNGVFYRHEMAYTSAEYAAKQVKFCGVCHINKLPPMDAAGEPIASAVPAENLVYAKTGFNLDNVTIIPNEWAHKQVQCIRCHSHAGIGTDLTGVKSD